MQLRTFSRALVVPLALPLIACGGSKQNEKTAPPASMTQQTQSAEPTPDASTQPPADERRRMISFTPDELKWAPLDPDAGDKGPMAAQLWGEMTTPSGMFIKVPAGNPGALHAHTGDYHAVAVTGTFTNTQDGQRRAAALPPQSYVFQPGGVAHTTACNKGAECIAYTHWPLRFDFLPKQPAKGAKVDARYVEKRAKDLAWQPVDPKNPKGVQFAALWGDPQSQPNGMLIKVPAGNEPVWHIHKFDYHGIVLAGTIHNVESGSEPKDLPVGSYWMQPGGYKHTTNCKAGGVDCVAYVHFEGAFDFKPAE